MKSKRRWLTNEEEDSGPHKTEPNKEEPSYIELFLYYVDYDPAVITWTKVKQFDEEFGMDLTLEQKNVLHDIGFKTNLNRYLK